MSFSAIHKHIEELNLSTTQLLLLAVVTCTSWFSLVNLTRWFWNRRKWPPGPKGLPLVGYLPFLGKKPHETLLELKKKYGDVMGLYMGTNFTVILSNYEVMKEVYNHPGSWDRSPDIFQHVPIGFGAANGKGWLEQRRFCLSITRDLGLGKVHWENLIMDGVSDFLRELETLEGKPTNISQSLGLSLTTNIITLLMGRKLTKEESDKAQLGLNFAHAFSTEMGPSSPLVVVPGLRKLLEVFKIAGYDRAATIIQQFRSFVREEIKKHDISNEQSDLSDFVNKYLKKLSTLSEQESDKTSFSKLMLEGNLIVIFLGSSDTIISSMTFLLKFMAEHRDVQEKVHKELMEVLGKEGLARYEERDKIPYTFAVLMESQRLSNMVPLSTTRRANQDIPIKGYIIPKGADITVNLYALHNDPKYWKECDKFLPERFLTNNGTKLIHNPPSFAPFSFGRRNCPGEHIAWMEILAYFGEIVKKFEISLPPGEKPVNEVVLGLVSHLLPHMLCFKKRY